MMPERAPLIAALLLDRPMCRECICAKSALDAPAVDGYLTAIGMTIQIRRQDGEWCRTCGATTTAFSLLSRLP
jgi:hypothetical protein